MSGKKGSLLALSLLGTSIVLVIAAAALELAAQAELAPSTDYYFAVGSLLFPVVGAVIAARLPANIIGWLFLGIGVLSAVTVAAHNYAVYGFGRDPRWPAIEDVAWVEAWAADWISPAFIIFLLLLFPTGRLARLERRIAWAAGATFVFGAASTALRPGPFDDSPIENPFGVEGAVRDVAAAASGALLVAVFVLAAASLLLRLRRAQGEERQQLKWFVYAAALLAATLLVGIPAEASGLTHGIGEFVAIGLFAGALFGIPLAAGIAILRYRLYDIDVVINRTLVYGSLTALLAGTYLGAVLLLGLALGPVTEGNELAVAVSMLAVAALFRPARRRIQDLVDRRFYRRKYDAERTLAAFSARLRDEVELEALAADLRAVVRETVQPAQVSLWLRETRR